jgi:ribosomal protein S18 acetylase RimI-like enzyme
MEQISDANILGASFKRIRLPRVIHVDYPKRYDLPDGQGKQESVLVASMVGRVAGYIRISGQKTNKSAWLDDLALSPEYRRIGIGTTMILASQQWALENHLNTLFLAVQPKNNPAIEFLIKMGFNMCGYQDNHFSDSTMAMFFVRSIR